MLDLYQPYRRGRRRRRLCLYSGAGILLLWLELHLAHTQHLQQHIHHQQHWQQALQHAQQLRAQVRARHPVPPTHLTSPTLLMRLRILTQTLPSNVWLEQLQLQAQRLFITGGYHSPSALLLYCRALQAHYPHSTRLLLTLLPSQHFHLELRSTKPVSTPTSLTTSHGNWRLRLLAWLQQEVEDHHLQLHSARSTGNHAYRLRFNATFAAIPHLLAHLEQLLGQSACNSLTLRRIPASPILQASVLCE